MTVINLKLPDAIFPGAGLRGIRLPNRRDLVAEYVLGVSEAESIKNRADPSKPMTAQGGGSITYTATSAHLRSHISVGFGFMTGVGMVPNDDATMLFIRKGGVGAQCFFAGIAAAWAGFRSFGANVYAANGEQAVGFGANHVAPANTVTFFEALVMSRPNPQQGTGGFGKQYYYSAGVQQVVTSAQVGNTVRAALDGAQIAIGSTLLTDSITTNSFDASFFAMYQRSLTPAEIDEAYQSLVANYALLGLTVV